MKTISKIILLFFLIGLVTSCATTKGKNEKSVHGDKPLIDPSEIVVQGREDMDKMVKAGPKPYDPDFDVTANKRKTLTTENIRNYVTIPDEYGNLKQEMSINLKNVDFKYAMSLMADVGDVNILVGDEVSGTVTAKLDQVPWDIVFQTLLDMKGLGADVNVSNGIIRVHSPEKLKTQETFKSERATVLKQKIQLEESVEPILAEIFRLYYISPEQAKVTLEDLFSTQGTEGVTMSNLKITVEKTTRSIIVRGHKPDLDVIDAVISEIDIKTKQVLIEAFIVDVTSDFAKALGARVGGMTEKNKDDTSTTISGMTSGSNAAAVAGDVTLGAAAGTISGQGIAGTSGIGILKTMSTGALKIELENLESLNYNKILQSPSIFTLNNQEAKITQGEQIPYQTTVDGTTTTEFKEAALSLTVTPSIIGDGNVLLNIKVNNDVANYSANADEPSITTNEITTKLLVSDGDIVVIGDIKKNVISDVSSRTPGVSKVPVFGNLFKSKNKTDKMIEMLIFIAPRVID